MPRKKTSPKTRKRPDLVLPDFARYFFVVAIAAVIILFFWVISPFFTILVYSAFIAVIFYPLHRWLLKDFRGRKSLSAFLSTVIVLLLVLTPLTLFLIFLSQEAVDAYLLLETKIQEIDINNFKGLQDVPIIGERLSIWSQRYGIAEFLQQAEVDIFGIVQEIGQTISTFLVNTTTSLLRSFGTLVVMVLILLLTVFFFFRDGDEIVAFMKNLSPLPPKYEREIELKLKSTIQAVVFGGFGTAILQGIAGGIGFAIAQVPNVAFWTTIMVLAAFVPYIGASVIWVPVAIALLIQGKLFLGLFLVIWGLVVVSYVDNVARPFLIGSRAKMHPLATFLVVLGGLFVWGIKGIIFGPLILALAITVMHIYQLEYSEVLKD